MLEKIKALLGWLNPRISVGREAGSDLFGWYNAVYVRVRGFTLHVGLSRDVA
jgi:hypothetical protein